MMGTSSQHHSVTASPGGWKPGGERLMKILPEPLTEHWWMAETRKSITRHGYQVIGRESPISE